MFQRGIFFEHDLELERALEVLSEAGFDLQEEVSVRSEVEVALQFENKRLQQKLSRTYSSF